MNYDEIIVPSITGALGAFVSWIFGRKKENVEIQSNEIKNASEIIALWKDMASELKQEVSELRDKIDVLSKEVHDLRSENTQLRLQLNISSDNN